MKNKYVKMKVEDLKLYENNSRVHDENQIKQIANSIEEFGFTNPILIDDKNNVIAGHGRIEAAKTLSIKSVPCVVVYGLTEDQKKAYVIADNKLALNAEWDFDSLVEEIGDLKDIDFDLELLGFNEAELMQLFEVGEDDFDANREFGDDYNSDDLTSKRRIIVHFKSDDDVQAFGELLGQNLTKKTRAIWHPKDEIRPQQHEADEIKPQTREGISGDADSATLITVKGIKAMVRADTSDPFVVDEVIKGNVYRKLNIVEGDVVLDVGMNIGMFTILALQKGAYVHSFEPDPDNFSLATRNINLNKVAKKFNLHELAVTGTDEPVRTFSINRKKNKGAHSLVEKRGRDSITVNCENINSVLDRVKPTVIKMDIEGGEYECIRAAKNFDGVREFILEFHHAHLNDIDSREKYTEITGILKTHFKNVDYRVETKKAWVTLIYCSN